MSAVDFFYDDQEYEDILTWLKIFYTFKHGRDTRQEVKKFLELNKQM